ncbi:hypothetical protein [Bradyrhizobium sp. 187]|jgi:hypothetical protein|uniref:hypothetical protein n=1 Tax=Bradyrhizobium sp. 187 TaxID=2782655 RepID=UPI001FFE2D43|nr:hypothetical protein [Bradyrhizobium sp. 187]UPJ71891.1 hypothetical protein IVB19_30565 [Bradyrhizobium sp. 187]
MSWKSKASWYIVADKDSTVQPELQRFVAKRIGATVFGADGSCVPKLAQPDFVLDVIRKAANAVRRLRRRKAHRACFSEPKRNPGDAKGEAPLQTSADFVRTYGAVVDTLTATILNAEAGLSWLSAQPPDLEEVRRTLNTIAKDGERAGEIVVRLRAPMKDPQRDDSLDP